MSRRQLPRATAAQLDAATFLPGEIAVDTTNDELRYDGDGSTVGGIALARKDGTNLTAGPSNVTATGSAVARTLADRFADMANVLDFGAIGDGVTDDSAAFEAAIATGKTVVGPALDYVVGDVDNLIDYTAIVMVGATLIRKSGATYIFRAASAKTGLYFEGFTLQGNQTGSPTQQQGISLVNAVRPTFRDVTGKDLYATFMGGPTGSAFYLSGGSGASFINCVIDTCGDGLLTEGHTDGCIQDLDALNCTRNGALLAASSHRWRHTGVRANGNCTAYAGAGFQVINSDDVVGFSPSCNSNTLGHGYQHNTGARGKLFSPTCNSNGISGVDWFQSVDGELHGAYCTSNTSRGVEIDTDSNRMKVFGGKCLSNAGDSQWSVFRSADVELHGVVGDVKIHDGSSTAYTVRTSIFGGGQGYTLTVDSGEAANVRLFGWLGSISDVGGHIVYSIGSSGLADTLISDAAYNATTWNGDATHAPSKNAVRDLYEALLGGVSSAFDTLAEIATELATKVTSGGALGTPSSGTLTNCSGLPFAGLTGSASVAQLGSTTYSVVPICFVAAGVNFNSANSDTAIALSLPTGFTRFQISTVRIVGASASLTTATCSVWSAAGGTGTAFVASGSTITVSTASDNAANNSMTFAITNSGATQSQLLANFPTLYFRVQNPQGTAVTGTVVIQINAIP